jgi:predicted dehydrogenase
MLNDRPVRVALVGAGDVAEGSHLPALRAAGDDVQIAALVEIDDERLHAVADRWHVLGRYTDMSAMLSAVGPDLVVLATPPAGHREQAVAALAAGAWVWCEKPPALCLADYDAITAAERDGGPYASIVFQQRYGSGARHARRLLASGALGRPLAAHCQTTWYRDVAYFAPAWRGSYTGDGGPSTALGIHQIDLLLALLGPWREVHAFAATTSRDIETDDVATAIVAFDSGALATVVTSAVSPREVSHLRVDTELATVEVTHLYRHRSADWTWTPASTVDESVVAGWRDLSRDTPSGHLPQLRVLLDDLRAGRRPETSGDGGRAALELITALYRSAHTGDTVKRGEIGPDNPYYHRLDGLEAIA